jgi:hypothetical protein
MAYGWWLFRLLLERDRLQKTSVYLTRSVLPVKILLRLVHLSMSDTLTYLFSPAWCRLFDTEQANSGIIEIHKRCCVYLPP